MIVKEETLKKIKTTFGLNIYEAKIWTALLSKGIATAGELSEVGDVPRSRSYDVLESLEKKGFIVMKLGKPIKYIAVEPNEVLKRVREKIEKKADSQIKTLKKVKETPVYNQLNSLYKNGIDHLDPSTMAGSIKGRNNLYSHIDSVLKRATKDVTIITTEEGIVRKTKKLNKTIKTLSQKGVKIKVYAPNTSKTEESLKQLAEFATIKNSNGLSARAVIIDGKEAVIMLNDDSEIHESYDTGIWVNTPYFAKMIESLVKEGI